jgi:hypothetical protein
MKLYEKIVLAAIAGMFGLGVIILGVAVAMRGSGSTSSASGSSFFGSANPKPHMDANSLEGCYVKTEMNVYSSQLKCTYYWFRGDGRVYFGIPPAGMGDADFSALQKSDPNNCGTYTVKGEKLTMQRNGGAAEDHTYTPDAGGMMDSEPLQNVWRFKDGATLEGKWGIDMAIPLFGGGGGSASSSTTWQFHSDGSFEGSGHAGVDTKQATGMQTSNGKGKYEFADNKLKITYNEGTTKSFNAMAVGSSTAPSIFILDGTAYNQER